MVANAFRPRVRLQQQDHQLRKWREPLDPGRPPDTFRDHHPGSRPHAADDVVDDDDKPSTVPLMDFPSITVVPDRFSNTPRSSWSRTGSSTTLPPDSTYRLSHGNDERRAVAPRHFSQSSLLRPSLPSSPVLVARRDQPPSPRPAESSARMATTTFESRPGTAGSSRSPGSPQRINLSSPIPPRECHSPRVQHRPAWSNPSPYPATSRSPTSSGWSRSGTATPAIAHEPRSPMTTTMMMMDPQFPAELDGSSPVVTPSFADAQSRMRSSGRVPTPRFNRSATARSSGSTASSPSSRSSPYGSTRPPRRHPRSTPAYLRAPGSVSSPPLPTTVAYSPTGSFDDGPHLPVPAADFTVIGRPLRPATAEARARHGSPAPEEDLGLRLGFEDPSWVYPVRPGTTAPTLPSPIHRPGDWPLSPSSPEGRRRPRPTEVDHIPPVLRPGYVEVV